MSKKKNEPCDCPEKILELLKQGKYSDAMKALWEYEGKKKRK